MVQREGRNRRGRNQRGATLVMIAGSLVMLLAMAGLAIDLAALYVARSEAQRAADAGALAGAQEIVDSTYPTGGVSQAVAETLAAQQAATVGNRNPVVGVNPFGSPPSYSYADCGTGYSVPAGKDICFDFSNATNPKVSVLVRRTAGSVAGPVPLYFMKIFGIASKDVSAMGTAEAYAAAGAQCLKPWLLPNCDPGHTTGVKNGKPDSSLGNPNCPITTGSGKSAKVTGYADYLVWESGTNEGQAVTPGLWTTGVVGEPLQLTPDTPQNAPAPSKYYEAWLPSGNTPAICPSCAIAPVGGGGGNSAALYRANIECCNTSTELCGPKKVQLTAIDGSKTGPTKQGTDCLITAPSQDTISFDASSGCKLTGSSQAYQICAGGGVLGIPAGTPISTSPSVVTVPIFDLPPGQTLCPGNSCNTMVRIYAYAQMFVRDVSNKDTVNAYLLGVGGSCGGSGPSSGGAAPFQVRLIHPPTS